MAHLQTIHFKQGLRPLKARIITSTGAVIVNWQEVAGDWVWTTSGTGDKIEAGFLFYLNKIHTLLLDRILEFPNVSLSESFSFIKQNEFKYKHGEVKQLSLF